MHKHLSWTDLACSKVLFQNCDAFDTFCLGETCGKVERRGSCQRDIDRRERYQQCETQDQDWSFDAEACRSPEVSWSLSSLFPEFGQNTRSPAMRMIDGIRVRLTRSAIRTPKPRLAPMERSRVKVLIVIAPNAIITVVALVAM